jgi:hypothetical protein
MLCLWKFALFFINSTTSPQRFGLGVWPWWQVPDPSLPHLDGIRILFYHILVVLYVPWIINIEPPFIVTTLGGYMFQVQTLWLYPLCLLACKVLQFFDSIKHLQMLCAKKVKHDSCLSRRKTWWGVHL